VSAVHSDEDIERTLRAYERAFRAMAADRAFGSS
jgi:glutamate-1-semialdehyde aminotransferase